MGRLVPLAVVVVLASCAHDPSRVQSPEEKMIPRGKVIEYGIYRLVKAGRLQQNTATSTGTIINKPVLEHIKRTNRIPIEQNTYFAYQYRISQLPDETRIRPALELKRIVEHPAMILPGGSKSNGSERIIRAKVNTGQVIALDGYAFNEYYEMVAGDWIFQIWYKEHLLIEQKFTSYWPKERKPSD